MSTTVHAHAHSSRPDQEVAMLVSRSFTLPGPLGELEPAYDGSGNLLAPIYQEQVLVTVTTGPVRCTVGSCTVRTGKYALAVPTGGFGAETVEVAA